MSKSELRNLKYKRDVALRALIKARKSKRKSSHLMGTVMELVGKLRSGLVAMGSAVDDTTQTA